ncbi:MAG: tetratricopeptide repeat protein [Bacteroidetes bacterium 43-16]|nr:MAG: tetratricopeptide repeat protein [Bacteroidetes bacterium 43-16]
MKTFAQGTRDNAVLQQMADEDQQERMNSPIDWTVLNRKDSIRRVKVYEMIAQQQLLTAKDHFNAGIVMQHGNDTIASATAVKSFETALRMDTSLNRWWYAAAVDRDLMRRQKPQVYGTQFIRDSKTGQWTRYAIDSTKVSDEQRRYYSVETLAEQKDKEYLMNQKSLADFYAASNSVDQTIDHIKLIFKKGRLSASGLEAEVNQLGYTLLNQHKPGEALKLFKLNTALYPESFNAFDSYGEGLLQAGKKKAAMKAYKKSLKLNPANEHAKRILDTHK